MASKFAMKRCLAGSSAFLVLGGVSQSFSRTDALAAVPPLLPTFPSLPVAACQGSAKEAASKGLAEEEAPDNPVPDVPDEVGGVFRGIAATLRSGIRVVGTARPLAFASELAVAGESIMRRGMYYGAWSVSGIAVCADIANKTLDAPKHEQFAVAAYNTAFHIPASLVIPAVIIHKVVHTSQHVVGTKAMFASLSPRMKALVPVACALLAIVPVVPACDHICEMVMEPTLGAWLGLEFSHHSEAHDDHHHASHYRTSVVIHPAGDLQHVIRPGAVPLVEDDPDSTNASQ